MIRKNTPQERVLEQAPACGCDACSHGCHYGSGAFTDEQLPEVAEFLGVAESELKEHYLERVTKFNTTLWRPKVERKDSLPYGECTFFHDGKCSIHPVKPLECQVAMGCEEDGEDHILWFTLNHFVNPYDPQSVREWQTHLKTGGKTLPGGEVEDLVPDKETREKILNYERLR